MIEKSSQIHRFINDLNTYIQLIFDCETNLGFIQKTIQLVQFLNQNDLTSAMTIKWQQLANDHFGNCFEAYEELIQAIEKLEKFVPQVKPHLDSILDKVCGEGGGLSVKELPIIQLYHPIRNLYCNFYAKSWDIIFAPKAHNILQVHQRYFSDLEAEPHLLWYEFKFLEEVWNNSREGLYCGWKKVEGDTRTRLMETHEAILKALKNERSSELHFLNYPNYSLRTCLKSFRLCIIAFKSFGGNYESLLSKRYFSRTI